MPRYFFHCAHEARENEDEGTDLADDQAAREMAIRFAGEALRDQPEELRDDGSWQVEVTGPDETFLVAVSAVAIDAAQLTDRLAVPKRLPLG